MQKMFGKWSYHFLSNRVSKIVFRSHNWSFFDYAGLSVDERLAMLRYAERIRKYSRGVICRIPEVASKRLADYVTVACERDN